MHPFFFCSLILDGAYSKKFRRNKVMKIYVKNKKEQPIPADNFGSPMQWAS